MKTEYVSIIFLISLIFFASFSSKAENNYLKDWIDHFNKHKKKDDLADSYLMTLFFIANRINKFKEKKEKKPKKEKIY